MADGRPAARAAAAAAAALLLLALLTVAAGPPAVRAAAPDPPRPSPLRYRWVYLRQNLQTDTGEADAESILRRAKAAGYNGAVIADFKLGILDTVPDRYFQNARRLKKAAEDLHLALYCAVAPFGYSDGLLAHDVDLAEGPPVKDAAFVAHGSRADAEDADADLLPDGGFEQAGAGDRFPGWSWQDAPGAVTFVDRQTVHSGGSALRLEGVGSGPNGGAGNGRIVRTVDVQPYHPYHLSVWVKTDGFAAAESVRATVLPAEAPASREPRALCYAAWHVRPTQDWTEYHAVFNSLGNRRVNVYLGVWGGTTGRLWFDDAHLSGAGLLNVVRRGACPVTIRDPATGTVYAEGRDYERIQDPRLGMVPWPGAYEVWHQPPAIVLTPGSRIRDGQRLAVSFWSAAVLEDGQVTACLAAPRAFEIVGDQIRRVRDLFAPAGYFLSHDEIRVAGWCPDCDPARVKKMPGQTLAANVRRCDDLVRKIAPGAERFVWSDMFDPAHNAHDDYYLVNGTWAGSWDGLPKDVVVVNWNSGEKAAESLRFFAGRGNKQILAGYYDGRPDSIAGWLKTARAAAPDSVAGVMYTTWADRYDDLEAFAKAAWGE